VTLHEAVEEFLEAVSADMCCEICEPSKLGDHRDTCPVPKLQEALDAEEPDDG
jgi:hypothetical protein